MDGQTKGPGRAPTRAEARDVQNATKYTTQNARTKAPDFEILGGPAPLLPPGTYQAQFVGWWTGLMFRKRPKIGLNFRIVDPGDHFGKTLTRWYNAVRLVGAHGDSGQFQVGRHSDFLADFARLIGMPSRTDRTPMSRLKKVVLLVKVETVKQRRNQEAIAAPLKYSVIRELLTVVAGSSQESD